MSSKSIIQSFTFASIKRRFQTQRKSFIKMLSTQYYQKQIKRAAPFVLNSSSTVSVCKICSQTTIESQQPFAIICDNCENTYDSKMQPFYSYLAGQKTLDSEHLDFTKNLVLQISSNFFLCQQKCNNHMFREVLVNAQTDKYIICDTKNSCANCVILKCMILMRKVPAINDLMKSSNLERFYLKWVSVFSDFLKKLTEGSVFETKLDKFDCYKNTGDRKVMMQPRKRTISGEFTEAVYSASTMKREIHLFITKYRLDRSMQVFSKALETQNLEFFINYDRMNIKREINNEYKTDVKNVDFVSGIQVKNRVLDLKQNYELHEKKRRSFLHFLLVEIFYTLALGETEECSKNEVAAMFECVVNTFSAMGPIMRGMASLTDSGEHICKEGLFRLPQSSIMKKCVLVLGQELGREMHSDLTGVNSGQNHKRSQNIENGILEDCFIIFSSKKCLKRLPIYFLTSALFDFHSKCPKS